MPQRDISELPHTCQLTHAHPYSDVPTRIFKDGHAKRKMTNIWSWKLSNKCVHLVKHILIKFVTYDHILLNTMSTPSNYVKYNKTYQKIY